MMPSRLGHRAERAESQENRLPKITGTRAGSYGDELPGCLSSAWWLNCFPLEAICPGGVSWMECKCPGRFSEVNRQNPSNTMTCLLCETRDEGPRGVEHMQQRLIPCTLGQLLPPQWTSAGWQLWPPLLYQGELAGQEWQLWIINNNDNLSLISCPSFWWLMAPIAVCGGEAAVDEDQGGFSKVYCFNHGLSENDSPKMKYLLKGNHNSGWLHLAPWLLRMYFCWTQRNVISADYMLKCPFCLC